MHAVVALLGIVLAPSAFAVECRKIRANSESRSESWRTKVSAPLELSEIASDLGIASSAPHAPFTKAWNDFRSKILPGDQLLLVEDIPLDPKLEHGFSRYVIVRNGCIQDALVVKL